MPNVRFLSYVRRIVKVSRIDLDIGLVSVREALEELARRYPELSDLVLSDVPEVSFILGDKTLVVPRDLSLMFDKELIIGPIIGGG